MSADDDPQPSTSSGVTRSETTAPLNEQEYKFLMENVGTNFGGVGVGDRWVERDQCSATYCSVLNLLDVVCGTPLPPSSQNFCFERVL